jgi:peroxiredoxin
MKVYHSKRSFLTVTGLLIMLAATAQLQEITISGQLQMDTLYSMIYLEDFSRTPQILESAPVDPEGKFIIRHPLNGLDFFKLKLDNNNQLIIIVLPGEQIEIASKASALGANPTISGSPNTVLLKKLGKEVYLLDHKIDSVLANGNSYIETDSSGRKLTGQANRFLMNLDSLRKEVIRDFIQKNPSSPACLFYSNRLKLAEDLDTFVLLNDSLYARYPENAYVRELYYAVTSQRYIQPGLTAPDIYLPDTNGDTIALSSLRGKVVLVDFWAAWCSPCRKENPNVVEAYGKYHHQGFEVYGVSLDTKRDSWIKAIQSDSLTWTHVSDLQKWDSDAAIKYAVRAIPFSVLIDREGMIIARELRGSALHSRLQELFGY